MAKKFISIFTVFCFLLPLVSFLAFADDNGDYKLFLNRDFEDGSFFDKMSTAAKTNIIKGDTEGGKEDANGFIRFQMSENKTEDCFIDIPIEDYTKDMIIEFDLSYDTALCAGMRLQYKDLNQKSSYLIDVSEGKAKTTAEQNEICGFEKNKWGHVAVYIDFDKAQLTAFSKKGKRIVKTVEGFKDASVNSLSMLRFYVNGESGSSILIDNLKIYEAKEPMENVKKEERQVIARKIQKPVNSNPDECGSAIFYNRTYEEDEAWNVGLSVNPKGNVFDLGENGANHFIRMEVGGETDQGRDGYIDYYVTAPTRFMVMEAEFSYEKNLPNVNIFQYKDINQKSAYLFSLKNSELIYKANAKPVGKLEEGKWLKLSVAIDFQTSSADIYSNGKLLFEGVSLPDLAMDSISSLRIWMASTAENAGSAFLVDNWRVYEGKAPRDIKEGEKSAAVSIMPTDDKDDLKEIQKLGDGAVMLNVAAETMYANGKKQKLDVGAYFKDNRTLVPVRAVSEAFGCDVSWNAEKQCVIVDGVETLTINSSQMKLKDGSTYELDVTPQITNSRTFIPLRALGEKLLNKNVVWNDRGLIIITNSEYDEKNIDYTVLNNYMLYDRPDSAALLSAYKNKSHPRVLLDENSKSALIERYNSNERVKKWGDAIVNTASNKLNSALPRYETPDGLRFGNSYTNGTNLAMAYVLTGDKKYADRAYKEILTVGEFKDWNPGHFLDTSTEAVGVVMAYDWCYDAFSDEQRKTIEDIIYTHAVKPTKEILYGQHVINGSFLKAKTNWNVICSTGMTMAAIALMDREDYKEDCTDVISKLIRGQEYMLPTFYPDGAWDEGPSYWIYLMGYLPYMYQTIEDNFQTDFNLTKAPGMSKTGYYLAATASAVGANNFHDASVGSGMQSSPAMFWLSDKYNDESLTKLRLYLMDKNKTPGSVMDMLYYNTNITDTTAMSGNADMYLGGVEFVSLRNSWTNDDGAFISYHGGYTLVNHYHVDSGTFVIDMLGERWASDLGGEDYNLPEMFGNKRADYYQNRPEGHNLYVINPQDGGVGQEKNSDTFAPVEKMVSSERGAYSVMNLDMPYKKYVKSAKRGIKLEDDRRSALVRDEFVPINDNSDVYWFMHTTADIEIIDNNTFVLSQNGKKVKGSIITNGSDAKLSKMGAVSLEWSPTPHPNENPRDKYSKICLNFKASGDTYVQMKITAYDDPISQKSMSNISLADWKNDEGELLKIPTVDMIYANKNPISGFYSSKSSYEIRMPYDVNAPYEITCDNKEGCSIDIVQAKTLQDTATVTIKNNADPTLLKTYTVKFITLTKLNDIFNLKRLQVIDNTASDTPEEANQPYNVSDNLTSTRWACEGECWLQLDLGSVKNVDAVALSFMKGNERSYNFDILVSDDGQIWTKVLSDVKTSSKTEDLELYNFDKTYSARYVRYVGYGNDKNSWNSVTEFAALEK